VQVADRLDDQRAADFSGHSCNVLRRGDYKLCRLEREPGDRILLVVPDLEGPKSSKRLEHELALQAELEADWAAQPVALTRYEERTALALKDPGGEPLERLIGPPLDATRFLQIAIALVEAVRRAHEQGLIHRDIKPANILFDPVGCKAWLTGFGIASRLAREHQLPEPPDVIAGTLAYMAPEQTGRMNRATDSRSDLYALGVTFYELLTGTLPFTATDPIELIHCHIAREPAPPSRVPEQISSIVMKLLAKAAEDRYQTALASRSTYGPVLLHRKRPVGSSRSSWPGATRPTVFWSPSGFMDATVRSLRFSSLSTRSLRAGRHTSCWSRGIPELESRRSSTNCTR